MSLTLSPTVARLASALCAALLGLAVTPTAGLAAPDAPDAPFLEIAEVAVELTSPTLGAVVTSPVTVSWDAVSSRAGEMSWHEVYLDGRLLRYVGRGGATHFTLPLQPGEHTLKVFTYDSGENAGISQPVTFTVGGPSAPFFADVPEDHPFGADILWLTQVGITTGYDDRSFHPAAPVTRAAMAAFIARINPVASALGETPQESGFTDVPPGHPFFREIALLRGSGISDGYTDGTFRPDAPVSRAAMAAFLKRYFQSGADYYVPPVQPRFTDVGVQHPLYREVSWLADSGIAHGYADGGFAPTAPVSRQAMAAFLHRAAIEYRQGTHV